MPAHCLNKAVTQRKWFPKIKCYPNFDREIAKSQRIRELIERLRGILFPTEYAVEWLERRMYQSIFQAIEQVLGRPVEVHFCLRGLDD